ncbi:hypothetical protein [Streptomyces albipurpureus]|uniref:Uncharacterized protein n=1 Tax=Streptomyces albipurpureus TaxID=2897419 RepID=A0ABT0V2Y8_9ACTN|nr:hypothetical protein [Streptomyces sp. CWNU-1]MCM2394255.1 hypothetical protein [Streptomyces sp. CWNU-1]
MNATHVAIQKRGPSDARKAVPTAWWGPGPSGLDTVGFIAVSGDDSPGPGEWDPGARPRESSLNLPGP